MKDRIKSIKKLYDKRYYIGITIIMACIPFICTALYCIKKGGSISQIYVPMIQLNDVLIYYKQIEAIVAPEGIVGFFGYNESCAKIGGFAAWNPTIYIGWIIWGKLLGWNFTAPVYANVAMLTLAMTVFVAVTKPNVKQFLLICFGFVTYLAFDYYNISAMPEVCLWMPTIIWTAYAYSAIHMNRNDIKILEYIILLVSSLYLTTVRGYYVLFFLLPIILCFRRKNKVKAIIAMIIAVASIFLFLWINSNFTAAYFITLVNMDWLKILLSSPIHGIGVICTQLMNSSVIAFNHIRKGFLGEDPSGGFFFIYILLMAIFTYKIVRHFKESLFEIGVVISMLLISMAYMLIYVLNERHIIGIIFALFLYLVMVSESLVDDLLIIVLIVQFAFFFVIQGTPEYYFKYDAIESRINDISNQLDNSITVTSDLSYDNVVIWLMNDDTGVSWNDLYAVPAGMGISCCSREYVIENISCLKSRYIITNKDETIDIMLADSGKELIAEYDNTRFWKLR